MAFTNKKINKDGLLTKTVVLTNEGEYNGTYLLKPIKVSKDDHGGYDTILAFVKKPEEVQEEPVLDPEPQAER